MLMRIRYFTLIQFIAVLLLGNLLVSCATNPVSGKKEFMLLSNDQKIQMGISYDPQVVANYGLYEDQKIQQFITTQGRLMARI